MLFKKIVAYALSTCFALTALTGCATATPAGNSSTSSLSTESSSTAGSSSAIGSSSASGTTTTPVTGKYKIGIITGTVAQGEEELRAAEALKKEYGDMIVTATYPDNFAQEQQQVIQTIKTMAQDPDMKAIVMVQAVPGTKAAFEEIKNNPETKDILLICGVVQEDPAVLAPVCDIVLQTDDLKMADLIVNQAKTMGATKIVHYSFARHMALDLLSQRRDLMKIASEKAGLEFIYAEAPDPLGEQGIPGAQQFMLEDVPKKIQQLGKDTAFFNTNCVMQEPLIKAILAGGALYPQQCCPSPLHAYPGALGISVPEDKMADIPYINEEIKKAFAAADGTGRFSTWPAPINMTFVKSGAHYAMEYIEGRTNGINDKAKLVEILEKNAGGKLAVEEYDNNGKTLTNFYMIAAEEYITF